MVKFDYSTGFNVSGNAHWGVCVKKCPKKGENVDFKPASEYPKGDKELTPWNQYDTEDLMGFCMPTQEEMKTKGKAIYAAMSASMGNMSRYLDDVTISWKIILVVGILSFFITLAYLYLLRWITKPILYISLFIVFIMGVLITVWCYNRAQLYPEGSDDRSYSYAAMVVSGIFTLVYTVFICC